VTTTHGYWNHMVEMQEFTTATLDALSPIAAKYEPLYFLWNPRPTGGSVRVGCHQVMRMVEALLPSALLLPNQRGHIVG
jgi:hypothetical protein